MTELRGRYFSWAQVRIRSGACGAPVVRPTGPIRPTMPSTITSAHTEAIFAKIRSGRWRASHLAKNWVGQPVAEVLGLDVRDPLDRAKIKAAINVWLASGKLRVVTAKDEKSMFKQYVVVAPR